MEWWRRGGEGIKLRLLPAATILVLLITLLGLGLRFHRLGAQSLWYDEGFSVYLARMSLGEITARTAADIQPPLYYYLLHAWIQTFGDREDALRSLSLLFGVLTIPLMATVAWQLFRSPMASILAALLVAVSPLHVWYGQETRMYTLLVWLCLLSSYLLLLVIQAQSRRATVGLWVAYTLTSIVALYTHYFAFFVLAFQGLYLLVVLWKRGGRAKHLIFGALASGTVIVLAYMPWLPHLLTRYGADMSYWLGQLKLQEALLDIALSFVGGESVRESVGIWLAIGYGLVFILCVLALLPGVNHFGAGVLRPTSHAANNPQYPLLFLLLYLLIPPALILALSYGSPKFNARYAMISHPALLLIFSGGLAALWQEGVRLLDRWPHRLVVVLVLAFLLGVSVSADYAIYADASFARANFRAVARYLRRHIAPDETVILTSGHMFPVFDYYAPDQERYLLPDSPTLDTTRTLDYSIASDLNEWLAGRGGVWVVRWQDEVVDPVGYLKTMLAGVGQEKPVSRSFRQVGLEHYRLPSGAVFSDQPAIAHPTNFNFGDRLRLMGFSQPGEGEVMLFWQALQPLSADYRVALELRDLSGQVWARWDGRPSAYLFPTDRWRVGQTVFGLSDLNLPPGTPPGDYNLEVGVYTEADPAGLDVLDRTGAPQGKKAVLGAVALSSLPATADEANVAQPVHISLGGGLALAGWELTQDTALPGDRVPLTLVWLAESPPQQDYRARLLVTDASGQTLETGSFPLTNHQHPTSTWLAGQAWRAQPAFRLPVQAQPGAALLRLEILDEDNVPLGLPVDLTDLQVLPVSRDMTHPRPQVPLAASLGPIGLVGADLSPAVARPGDTVSVTLYWEALQETEVPYTAFAHLLGANGQVVAGDDSEPAGGTRPTTSWLAGEFVPDVHDVAIPAGLQPGEYWIELGLYDAQTPGMPRLPVLDDAGHLVADRVLLGPIAVRQSGAQ